MELRSERKIEMIFSAFIGGIFLGVFIGFAIVALCSITKKDPN
jgi:uncharacterized membrane-anchored protein YitT (DUF2179 family)